MRFLRALAVLVGVAAPAIAAPATQFYKSEYVSTTTGKEYLNIAGVFNVAATSQTASTPTISLDGAAGGINGSSATLRYGIRASSATIPQFLGAETHSGSMTVTGAGGISATYGVSGATAVFPSADIRTISSSMTVIGAGGLGVTYGLTSASAAITALTATDLTATNTATVLGSATISGAGGAGITYGLSAASATLSGNLTASSGTFTASGQDQYSLVTSSGINIVAGCLMLGGVSQCTGNNVPLGGSPGLGSTQTFSGANTFTSSVTVGPQVYTSTAVGGPGATIAAGRITNVWQIVASTSVGVGTSSVSITGLQADKFYRVRAVFDQNTTAGYFGWRYNGDATASAYKWAGQGLNTNGTRNDVTSSGDNECQQGTFTMQTGFPTFIEITFRTSPSDNTRVIANLSMATSDTNPFYITLQGVCFYDGASALSSINLYPSAGSFSGVFYLEQLVTQLP